MEIRRMTLSEETKKKLASVYPANRTRKREIRISALKELIQGKENGHLFKLDEIREAIGYPKNIDGQSLAWQFVNNLKNSKNNKGIVIKPHSRGKYELYLNDNLQVKKPAVVEKVVEAAVTLGKEIEKEKARSQRNYNVHIIIEKQNGEDYGSTKLVDMSLNRTTLKVANDMINEVMKDVQ